MADTSRTQEVNAETHKFRNVTPELLTKVLSEPNAQVLLFCHASWAQDHCRPMHDAILSQLPLQHPLHLIALDVESYPDVVDQLQITHLPTAFAIHSGHFLDKVEGSDKRTALEKVKEFVANFVRLHIVKSAVSESLVPGSNEKEENDVEEAKEESATTAKWITMASDLMRKGQLEYSAKMYEKTMLAAETREGKRRCLAGIILSRTIKGEAAKAAIYVPQLREVDPDGVAAAIYDMSVLVSPPNGVLTPEVSQKSVAASLQGNSKDVTARVQLVLLYFLAGRAEEALTEVIKVASLDRELARGILGKCVGYLGGEDSLYVLKTRHFLARANLE
eukprot:PhM_4_TR18919/c0_g1_i1/m.15507